MHKNELLYHAYLRAAVYHVHDACASEVVDDVDALCAVTLLQLMMLLQRPRHKPLHLLRIVTTLLVLCNFH